MGEWLTGRHGTIPADRLDPLIREISGRGHRDRKLILLGLGVLIALILLAGGGVTVSVLREGRTALDDLKQAVFLTGPALLAMLLAGIWMPLSLARRARLGRVRGAMLRRGLCPHCAYDLSGLPSSAGGLLTCPECACVWDPARAEAGGPVSRTTRGAALVVGAMVLLTVLLLLATI
jgi:hypothetical protein